MTKHSVKRRTLCCALAIALALCSIFALGSIAFATSTTIGTAAEFETFAADSSNYATDVTLTASFTLPSTWTPIGNATTPYTGAFNGAGYTITITAPATNNTTDDYRGVFGYVGATGTVQNLTVAGAVTGRYYVGGIAGYSVGTITNCANTATITAYRNMGGIVGANIPTTFDNGIVSKCYNTGNLYCCETQKKACVGGIAGQSRGTVEYCYNWGDVTGCEDEYGVTNDLYSRAGGIVGANYNGTVSKVNGVNVWTPNTTTEMSLVTCCYSIGNVPDAYAAVGAVVGENEMNVINCYYLTGASTLGIGIQSSYTNSATVKTQAELQASGFENTLDGSANPDIFAAVANGYPILAWQ